MYKIKYYYQTGDSFHTEDKEDYLEIDWKDINIAKEALKRIEEHYKWYRFEKSHYPWSFDKKIEKPKWHKVDTKYKDNEVYLLNLPLDNGKEVQIYCPWCGYFERLYSAEIVLKEKYEVIV